MIDQDGMVGEGYHSLRVGCTIGKERCNNRVVGCLIGITYNYTGRGEMTSTTYNGTTKSPGPMG